MFVKLLQMLHVFHAIRSQPNMDIIVHWCATSDVWSLTQSHELMVYIELKWPRRRSTYHAKTHLKTKTKRAIVSQLHVLYRIVYIPRGHPSRLAAQCAINCPARASQIALSISVAPSRTRAKWLCNSPDAKNAASRFANPKEARTTRCV